MPFVVVCQSCHQKHRLSERIQGRKFLCRGCGEVLLAEPTEGSGRGQPAASRRKPRGRRAPSKRRRSEAAGRSRSRPKRKRRPAPATPPQDDLFGGVLDEFGGDYGSDLSNEDDPWRPPARHPTKKKRRRRSHSSPNLAQILFSFEGRIRRRTFWYSVLMRWLLSVAMVLFVFLVTGLHNRTAHLISFSLMNILFLWMHIAVQVKRFHDRGKSGFMVLINLIPLFGGLWTLVECGFLPGTPGRNEYGPEP